MERLAQEEIPVCQRREEHRADRKSPARKAAQRPLAEPSRLAERAQEQKYRQRHNRRPRIREVVVDEEQNPETEKITNPELVPVDIHELDDRPREQHRRRIGLRQKEVMPNRGVPPAVIKPDHGGFNDIDNDVGRQMKCDPRRLQPV